jgi:hypothetical protein
MKTICKKIILVDQHDSLRSELVNYSIDQNRETFFLDPVQLFNQIDWTQFDQDAEVIKEIYSRLFEEVIINQKQLLCFWPLSDQLGSEWLELSSLCKQNKFELDAYRQSIFTCNREELSTEILNAWKKFTYFLVESLLGDIQTNEHFEEIATLTGSKKSIVLFKMEENGCTRYSFSPNLDFSDCDPKNGLQLMEESTCVPLFESFNDMLNQLLLENDLSDYRTSFIDKNLEKAYFNALAKDFKTGNLIQYWLETYSLN